MTENLSQLINKCSYVDSPRVNNDVEEAILNYRSLKFRQGAEADNPGTAIIVLSGTIPVSIQGSTYYFPIEVTLPSLYPIVKPDVVLKPTSTMVIDPSHPNVDQDGVVTTPYLESWVPEDHTVLFALLDMIELFSRKSPLHSRPTATTATSTTSTTSTINSPTYVGFRPPSTSTAYTPYGSAAAASSPYPYPYSGAQQQQQPYPPQQQQQPYPQPSQQQRSAEEERRALVEGRRRVKEELEVRAQTILADTAELEARLREAGEEARKGEAERARAEAELEKAKADVAAAEREGAELAAWVEEHEKSAADVTPAMVDALTRAEDALERQLVEAAAADGAISDLLYALDKALRDGALEFDVYLRLVRKYAAEQYNAKALAEKIKRALYY